MADNIKINSKEEKFRKDNQWYSFTTAVYGAVGMASFFGLLGMLANTLVKASVSSAGMAEAMALLGPAPIAVIGGLMALGIAATYMSQNEATKLKSIQDTHLAEENARCASHDLVPSIAQEHEQNCRPDGKEWSKVVKEQNSPMRGAVVH